jgi:hypothetical protein
MTTPASTTFRVDPLHPSRLLCEGCGKVVCELPADSEVMEHAGGLTTRQAALAWPEQAAAIQLHSFPCEWWRTHPKADAPVYVHVTERD